MRKRISGLLLTFTLFFGTAAQSPQDWIGDNQSYVKLKVAEDGWYRVSSSELQEVGFPVATVSAAQLQLFRRGEEVAINTETQEGSAVLDYFEFWGEKNSGIYDARLYEGDIHPHTYYNLFTDTATYFLTWSSSTNHKRIQVNTQNDDFGLAPTTKHQKIDRILQVNEYATGRYFGGSGGDFQLSDYDGGEGWTGSRVSKGSSQDFAFSLEDWVAIDTPSVEIIAIGRNSLQHVVTVLAGASAASLTEVGNFSFDGYTAFRYEQQIDPALIGGSGELIVRCTVTGVDGATDFVSFSSVQIVYAQALNLQTGNSELFTFSPSSDERRYLQIQATAPDQFTFYDVTDPWTPVRLPQNSLTNQADLVFPSAATQRKIAAVATTLQVPDISFYSFDPIDLTGKNYLLITHELLRDHPDGTDPIQDYANYRSSTAGGNYDVVVAEIGDIYDQFNYGDPSVVALVNLFSQSYAEGINQALILGKGRTINQNLYRKSYGNPDSLSTSEVFIPTYGVPGGDNMFSIGLNAEDELSPAIATGRVSAWKPDHIRSYLDKVIETEATNFDALWRKNLLHLSGGTTVSELSSFAAFIENFKDVAEGDYLGGRALNQNKQTSAVSEEFDLSEEVNQGVGFITLFGHSSNTVTDVEIGTPSNEAFNYQNDGRYPLIIVNGCKAGEIFGNTFSFGEDWVSFPSAGAIGFIAHADQASSNNLKRYTDRLYEIGLADTAFFGASIGQVMIEAAKQYYQGAAGTSESSQTQIQQTLFQGDPALSYFGASSPDFALIQDQLSAKSISGGQLLAQQDSFLLRVPVANYGVTTTDSLGILVERTYPDGSQQLYTFLRPPVRYSDTLEFFISNDLQRELAGTHSLMITLDPDQSIAEIDELNNEGSLEVFISAGSTIHLFPYDQAVVTEDTLELVWQPTNLFEVRRGFLLEIDSILSFSSPFFQQRTLVGENLLTYEMDLSNVSDGSVLYWRTRFSDLESPSDSIFETSSFTYNKSLAPGWGQFDYAQFIQNEYTGMTLDPTSLQLSYSTSEVPVEITTQGTEFFDYESNKVVVNQSDLLVTVNTIDPFCRTNTLNAIVFDKDNGQLKRPISLSGLDINESLVCGRLPQMIYNLTSTELYTNRRLEELINKMDNGDQIVLFNLDSISYGSFDAGIVEVLSSVGIDPSTITTLQDGQPLVAFGKKGALEGTALVFFENGSALEPRQQTLIASSSIIATASEGTIKSGIIGPATSWGSYEAVMNFTGDDQVAVNITAYSAQGVSEEVEVGSLAPQIDLSQVDAKEFPFLSFSIDVTDPLDLTPPSLQSFYISFEGSPESVLVPNQKVGSEVPEGQLLSKSFDLLNISKVDFQDSVHVRFKLRNVDAELVENSELFLSPLVAGDTARISYERSTVGLSGENDLSITVETGQVERVNFNNKLTFNNVATVIPETIRPLVDVTIDGRYILDGEIVSSKPLIHISFTDENRFLRKKDTTGISLSLQTPGGTGLEKVLFTDPDLIWSAADEDKPFEIDYQPNLVDDGMYMLSVTAEDESGNAFSEEPYQISFEVINESSITHFFPYPNPFSTQCRFVFTITGSTIPENLMIQIMTISGRVVKTIDEIEIGTIQIGNNITDYAWDGRDEYGDLLANGVYLYRVIVQSEGQELERRNTSADQALKRGIGKLYILR